MGQALWVWVTLLPVLILNGSRADNNFQWSDAVGAVLWVVGFACEATADLQKSSFKFKPENKGKFINTGALAQDNSHVVRVTLSSAADHTTHDGTSSHTARHYDPLWLVGVQGCGHTQDTQTVSRLIHCADKHSA